MKIYVSHSTGFDFANELYEPLAGSALGVIHYFIFPHKDSLEAYPSKEFLQERKCDLVLAEVSYPSTGMGMELAWAHAAGIKIICVHKRGVKISDSLAAVCRKFISYTDTNSLVAELSKILL